MASRLPSFIKGLIWIYLLMAVGALALALMDPANDPLSGLFLVLLSLPWILALDWINETVGLDASWLNIILASLGVILNAVLLYLMGRLVGWPRRRRQD